MEKGVVRGLQKIDRIGALREYGYTFTALDGATLDFSLGSLGFSRDRIALAKAIYRRQFNSEEGSAVLQTADSRIGSLIKSWNAGPAKSFLVSSVGMAIAHANIRRKIGAKIDLTIWINET